MSSKRHSMPVGPRPLQLASGPISDGLPSAPLSASNPLSPSTPTTPNGGPRRASSIVYNPATRPARTAGHRSALQRSNSVGGTLDLQKSAEERSPVTLAEKHADLLHFIAQKESKCLELRSQLAMHEAELLQLKRKWERIVSRGFISPHNASTPTPLASSLEANANGGAVLDGIREGVQGVGRFIAALSPTSATYHTSLESAAGFPLRANGINGNGNGTHSKSSSLSTMATTTTTTSKSTRFSLSSQSSLGEEPAESETSSSSCPTNTEDDTDAAGAEEEDGAQVLMVHDTGATPTMSPNPAFAARRDRERDRARQQPSGTGTEGDSSAEAEADFFFAQAQVQAAASGSPSPTRTPQTARPGTKRSVSSSPAIPGLGGLGLVDSAGVSAWVGSVGKNVSTKWEELQKVSTIAKNTKRASLLFSDIAYALQVGPAPSSSPSPTPSPAPSSHQPPSASPTLARSASTSLLDDDDYGGLSGAPMLTPTLAPTPVSALSPTLKPTPAPTLSPIPGTPVRKPSLRARQQQQQQQPQAQSPLSLAKSRTPPQKVPTPTQKQDDDDDDEWNW
ncbi:hypothetical protein C8R45DRAFT_1214102 [Mycena sanguinolenta]|nr:hypothetical protein C8R45DRAFT_1214102 [Mycena sanguinolenta]